MRPGEINFRHCFSAPRAQRGMVAILMLLILIVGGSYFLLGQLSQSKSHIDSEKKTAEALSKAKEALIAWAVANQTTPGMFPWPDRGNDAPFYYDGLSDCANNPTFNSTWLLGKIPSIGSDTGCLEGIVPLSLDVRDGAGEVLWYAVSRNLVAHTALPVINPDILNTAPFPWLVVRDRNGNPISERVAAVIIAPGPTLWVPGQITQNRNGVAPLPIQFLEGIPGVATNADYDGLPEGAACSTGPCEDFVMSEPYAVPPPPPPGLPNPIIFNDRLIYITIDELMPLLEKRAAREARSALNDYYTLSAVPTPQRFFPYAAPLGYPFGVESCNTTMRSGFLPVPTCNCSCDNSAGTRCTCSCASGAQLTTSGIFSPLTGGGCVGAGTSTCNCSTVGVAAMGTCVTNSNNVTDALTGGRVIAVTGNVTATPVGPNPTTCSYSGAGQGTCMTSPQTLTSCGHTPRALTNLPAWFMQNGWHWFLYYAIADDCQMVPPGSGCGAAGTFLTVGTVAPVDAVVISTGRAILGQNLPCSGGAHPTQARPTNNRCDYMDDIENTDGNTPYTDVRQPLANNFNDQAVIVRP